MKQFTITESFTYKLFAESEEQALELFSQFMQTDDDDLVFIGNETEVTEG